MVAHKGLFITFEGDDGSGKTTQSKLLCTYIKDTLKQEVIWTREPGGSPRAETIRRLLVQSHDQDNEIDATTEALLMFAARRLHLIDTIKPALEQGIWVVCDRFVDSSFAYQGYGKNVPLAFLNLLTQYTVDHIKPDRTYLLDAPVDVTLARTHQRSDQQENRFEKLGHAFHEKVRKGFLTLATQDPMRFCILDATQSVVDLQKIIEDDVCQRFFDEKNGHPRDGLRSLKYIF